MELRAFAHALVTATTLEGKRATLPPGWTDDHPGEALRLDAPGRPTALVPVTGQGVRVPPLAGMPDPAQRRRILHALANHELQAAELFAWALLAWPEMPRAFRVGCAKILGDEQRHMGLFLERLAALGGHFGQEPVSAHFWSKVPELATPLDFICTLGLTLEGANLDFSLEHAQAARAAGDAATADVLQVVHDDEVDHVRFAWVWLQRLAPEDPDRWATYARHVRLPGGPARARGATFDAAGRRAAGLDEAFIDRLAATPPRTPGGAPRR
jgi:uncharacterized ferritin-like protein (DUF455 family)